MRVYLSGKITGDENWQEKFNAVAAGLRLDLPDDWEIVNPAEVSAEVDAENERAAYGDYMRKDLKILCDCGAIFLLPDWKESRGATVEFLAASACGLKIEMLSEKAVAGYLANWRNCQRVKNGG